MHGGWQVNGKTRGEIEVGKEAEQDQVSSPRPPSRSGLLYRSARVKVSDSFF
jgi:hypothetical protein